MSNYQGKKRSKSMCKKVIKLMKLFVFFCQNPRVAHRVIGEYKKEHAVLTRKLAEQMQKNAELMFEKADLLEQLNKGFLEASTRKPAHETPA